MAFEEGSKIVVPCSTYMGQSKEAEILGKHLINYMSIEDMDYGCYLVYHNGNIDDWMNTSITDQSKDSVQRIYRYKSGCYRIELADRQYYPQKVVYVTGEQWLLRSDGTHVVAEDLLAHDTVLGYVRYGINGSLSRWTDVQFLLPDIIEIESIEWDPTLRTVYSFGTMYNNYIVNDLLVLN